MTAHPRDILLATGNPSKIREMIAILATVGSDHFRWISLSDLPNPPPEPVEDGDTFAANARLKATYYSKLTGLWAIADDSGLDVDALGGQPGIHSARFAGLDHTADRKIADAANNRKLIDVLKDAPPDQRTARFHCVVALADGDRILAQADGRIEGRIIDKPRGSNGFGYDPHFFIDEINCTTAELPAAEKNRISHRARALNELAKQMRQLITNLQPLTPNP